MHAAPTDAHLLDHRVFVLLAPIPKLSVQTWHSFLEAQCARIGQTKIENVVVRAAKARSLSSFLGVIAQPVRDDKKLSPIKRHPESRSQTPERHPNDGNCLTTTP